MSGFISARGVADVLTTTLPNAGGAGTSTAMTSEAQVTSGSTISMSKIRKTNSAASTYDKTVSASPSVRQDTRSGHGGRPSWVSSAGPWSRPGSRPWSGTPTTFLTHTTTVTTTLPPPTAGGSQLSSPLSTKKGGINIDGSTAAGIGVGVSIALLGIGVAIAYFCWARSSRRKRRKAPSPGQESGKIEQSNNDNTLWLPYPYFASNNESPVELPAAVSPREMAAENKPQEKDASDDRGTVWLGENGWELERQASKASVDVGARCS